MGREDLSRNRGASLVTGYPVADMRGDRGEFRRGPKVCSDFLFVTPSWIYGPARVVDLWGVFDRYNTSLTGHEADAKALYCDWFMVGQDLLSAIETFSVDAPLDQHRSGGADAEHVGKELETTA